MTLKAQRILTILLRESLVSLECRAKEKETLVNG